MPFLISLLMLIVSVYFRAKLHESPTFQRMKAAHATSEAPIKESFTRLSNLKNIGILFVIAAGLGAIFGICHFYSMFFVTKTLKVPIEQVQMLFASALIVATPLYLFFGWLSDRIGRKPIIVAACLLSAVTTQPIFKALTHYANPALERFIEKTDVVVNANDCHFNLFAAPKTDCDKVKGYLTDLGIQYQTTETVAGAPATITIGDHTITGFNPDAIKEALISVG